jgi:hypothetical protein
LKIFINTLPCRVRVGQLWCVRSGECEKRRNSTLLQPADKIQLFSSDSLFSYYMVPIGTFSAPSQRKNRTLQWRFHWSFDPPLNYPVEIFFAPLELPVEYPVELQWNLHWRVLNKLPHAGSLFLPEKRHPTYDPHPRSRPTQPDPYPPFEAPTPTPFFLIKFTFRGPKKIQNVRNVGCCRYTSTHQRCYCSYTSSHKSNTESTTPVVWCCAVWCGAVRMPARTNKKESKV